MLVPHWNVLIICVTNRIWVWNFCCNSCRDTRQNKGSILKNSVDYIRKLKKDQDKMHNLEDKNRLSETTNRKLLLRVQVGDHHCFSKISLNKIFKINETLQITVFLPFYICIFKQLMDFFHINLKNFYLTKSINCLKIFFFWWVWGQKYKLASIENWRLPVWDVAFLKSVIDPCFAVRTSIVKH